jgi:phosphoketolase
VAAAVGVVVVVVVVAVVGGGGGGGGGVHTRWVARCCHSKRCGAVSPVRSGMAVLIHQLGELCS